ncbi:hypothetical protein Taro_046409 [Colocasia esculenta]|uniref:Proteasome assembly chaperone 3 n=1 Tax=Colocasia esculenta TaxID=4460 RepID=A0A843WYU2_COLES|nr:hypothetical protein [Colocasia esculenta]
MHQKCLKFFFKEKLAPVFPNPNPFSQFPRRPFRVPLPGCSCCDRHSHRLQPPPVTPPAAGDLLPGNKTDIAICSYDDHFMVIATQIGSMGTILHARKEESVSTDPTFNVSVLFGKRDEVVIIFSYLLISCGSSRRLVLSLGLKDHSVETLKGIVSAVIENRMW